jgi:hypothetical protein
MIRRMEDFTRLRAVGSTSIRLRRYVGRGRGEIEIPFSEPLSVERMAFGNGLRLHLRSHHPIVVLVKRGARRSVESALREHGVQIVDEYGCRIDQSQFDKEADPSFNSKIGPGFWAFLGLSFGPRWLGARLDAKYMRQSSDNARSE